MARLRFGIPLCSSLSIWLLGILLGSIPCQAVDAQDSVSYRLQFKDRTGPVYDSSEWDGGSAGVSRSGLGEGASGAALSQWEPAGDQGTAKAKEGGPCSTDQVVIPVYNESDIYLRTQYPPTQLVLLKLFTFVTLSRGLVLDQSWACTRMVSPPGVKPWLLAYWPADMPAVTVVNTSNIWFHNVKIHHGARANSKACEFPLFDVGKQSDTQVCPGIYVVNSFGVQFSSSLVIGRIDIFRSASILLDHVKATVPENTYDPGHDYRSFRTHGIINIGQVSAPSSNGSKAASNIVISNCEIFGGAPPSGAWELITLFQGASGVTVANNYLHDFIFTAIRCGDGVDFVMDCYENTIKKNFIFNPDEAFRNSDPSNAGVHFFTRWFNPGNQLSCNYIYNQRFCYRLGLDSSGISIDGGTCLNGIIPISIDNGKFNRVKNVVAAGLTQVISQITCSTLFTVNCYFGLGNNWEALRRAYYDTPKYKSRYPEMNAICDPIQSSINHVVCNPPSQTNATMAQTGYCSSLPYGNNIQLVVSQPPLGTGDPQPYVGCSSLTIDLSLLNNQTYVNVTKKSSAPDREMREVRMHSRGRGMREVRAQARSLEQGGGATSDSAVAGAEACPWAEVGPLPVEASYYHSFFNISKPSFFDKIVSFDISLLRNSTLFVPPSEIIVGPAF